MTTGSPLNTKANGAIDASPMYLNFERWHPAARQTIVSLVPSQTELLYYLGLGAEVAGITKFCVHPTEWRRKKVIVGGTKNVHADAVTRLAPSLILANKEENVKEQVEALAELFPVYVSDVHDLDSACAMIAEVGRLTGRQEKAALLIDDIRNRFGLLPPAAEPLPAAYLIWQQPFMTVGGDTYIHQMMQYCGLRNVFEPTKRYPELSIEDLRQSGCRYLLLSSEPFPFREKHVAELAALLPGVTVLLVDGEMFSWYGSRLIPAATYFGGLRSNVFTKTGQ